MTALHADGRVQEGRSVGCTYWHSVANALTGAGTNQAAALTGRDVEHRFEIIAPRAYRHVHMGMLSVGKML